MSPQPDGLVARVCPTRRHRPEYRWRVATLALAAILAGAGCDHWSAEPARMRKQHESQPLGEVRELTVNARLSTGQLVLDQADASQLYALDTQWDAANLSRSVRQEVTGSAATLHVAIEGQKVVSAEDTHIGLSLSDKVALDLNLETGAGENKLDMTGLSVRRIDLKQGAGSVELWADAPQEQPCRSLTFNCGVGETKLRGLSNMAPESLEFNGGIGHAVLDFTGQAPRSMRARLAVGIGQLEVILPRTVGVRIELEGNLTGVSLPDEDFRKVGNTYTSTGYADTLQRLELVLITGLGDASVRFVD